MRRRRVKEAQKLQHTVRVSHNQTFANSPNHFKRAVQNSTIFLCNSHLQSVPQGITDRCSRRPKIQDSRYCKHCGSFSITLKAPWLSVWHHCQQLRSYFGLKTIQYSYVIQSCAVRIIKHTSPVNLCSARQSGAVSPTQWCNRLCSAVQCNQLQWGQFAPNRCKGHFVHLVCSKHVSQDIAQPLQQPLQCSSHAKGTQCSHKCKARAAISSSQLHKAV